MIAVAFAMFAVRSAETGSVADGPILKTSRLKHQRDRYDAMMRLGPNGLPPLALTKALQQAAACGYTAVAHKGNFEGDG